MAATHLHDSARSCICIRMYGTSLGVSQAFTRPALTSYDPQRRPAKLGLDCLPDAAATAGGSASCCCAPGAFCCAGNANKEQSRSTRGIEKRASYIISGQRNHHTDTGTVGTTREPSYQSRIRYTCSPKVTHAPATANIERSSSRKQRERERATAGTHAPLPTMRPARPKEPALQLQHALLCQPSLPPANQRLSPRRQRRSRRPCLRLFALLRPAVRDRSTHKAAAACHRPVCHHTYCMLLKECRLKVEQRPTEVRLYCTHDTGGALLLFSFFVRVLCSTAKVALGRLATRGHL